MEADKYKYDEKVLCKVKGKVSIPDKEPQEAQCLITEGHVIVEIEKPIKIPMLRIKDHRRETLSVSASYSAVLEVPDSWIVILSFSNEQNKKTNYL